MSQFACLPYETAAQHGPIIYMGAGGDYKIIANHSMPDVHRCQLIAVDAPVVQTARPADAAIISNAHILNGTGVQYHHMIPDAAYSGSMLIGIKISDFLHPCNQFRTMAVKRQYIGLVCRKLIINQHLAASRFIQNRYLHPVPELRHTVYQMMSTFSIKVSCPIS